MNEWMQWALLGAVAVPGARAGLWTWQRLQLSRAKHPSLAGHARWSQRLARWTPGYQWPAATWMTADQATDEVVQRRREGLDRLKDVLQDQAPVGTELTRRSKQYLPDVDLTTRYKVPFPYAAWVTQQLSGNKFLTRANGARVVDADGRSYWDLTGSYGVNLLGHEQYKVSQRASAAVTDDMGMVLGAYHPVVLDNLERLARWSGHEQFTFHMSGTEAVMQAVRLARYHTGRRHVVRFCGAYHGWWDDVQPGPGNPLPARDTYTLAEMSERTLEVIRSRKDIACVLVNPIQALHPNRAAPGDSTLLGRTRISRFDREAYTDWLQRLKAACTEAGVAFILDEVFLGFRLAPGGAQEYFGVKADLVTYGKTVGGGWPVGVVCGSPRWMQRYRIERPAHLCFARGTFNAHPGVMASMNVFLKSLDTPEVQALYRGADERWAGHREALNVRLQALQVPVQVEGMGSVWTTNYLVPGRYHWMLQFYLQKHGLWLSWIGTGRLIFSIDLSDEDMADVITRWCDAAAEMKADGWWSSPPLKSSERRWQWLREWWQHRQRT